MSNTSFPLLKHLAMQKWKPEQVYEKVEDEESIDGFPVGKAGGRRLLGIKARSLATGMAVAGLMAACITGIVWWPGHIQAAELAAYEHSHESAHPAHPPHAQPDDVVATCGSSVEEAQALNCTWDLLASSWLPPACIDQELTDEFREQGPWRFFEHKNRTGELFEPELPYRVGPGMEYYSTLRWHKVHCGYQWRKMHRAMMKGMKIEGHLNSYAHTEHCGVVALQQGEMEDLVTLATVEFMTC